MPQMSLNEVIIKQAMKHADAFQMPLGEVLMYYWMISFQHLYRLDPYATAKIDVALHDLTADRIDMNNFYQLIDRPTQEITEIVDIDAGLIQTH